jgi:hypothetical protein
MGLLNPLLLLLGAAAAVPLLLHLLQRHHGPRVVFPALRYLRRAEKESARRIRVRQILLMILRVAAVLLIALAAARPFTRLAGSGHSPTAVAIVLDNGLSSGVVEDETRVLDELKARALEVLADAGPDDRFWLVRAGSPGEPALQGDAEATALRVRETESTIVTSDLAAALGRARAVLAAGAEGRAAEIHLLSDLQVSSFPAVLPAAEDAPPVIVWHPGRPAPPNRGITDVEVGGGLSPVAGTRSTVAVRIDGAGADPVPVRLLLNGRLIAAGSAQPGATAVLSLPAQAAGVLTGRVEIDGDAFHADDDRYFAVRVLPPPSVGIQGDLPFLNEGLEVLADAGRIRRAAAADADVALLEAGAGAEAARGTIVILPPRAPVELTAANRRLAAAGIPWRFAAPGAGEARFAPQSGDPLLRALEGVRLRDVYPLQPQDAAGDSVLLRLADGTPWAVRGERRTGGIFIVLGSPLTAEASTIPTSAAMLPLLDRLAGTWAMNEPPRTEVDPGAEVRVPDGASLLERPDGTREPVAPGTSFLTGAEAGAYRFLRGDSVVAAVTVNPAVADASLARLDRRALEARLPGWRLHVNTDAGAWRRAAFRERLGRELWRPILVLLLVLLAVETAVAAAGRSRSGTESSAPREAAAG